MGAGTSWSGEAENQRRFIEQNQTRIMYTISKSYYTILLRDERRELEPGFDIAAGLRQLLNALIGALGWLIVCLAAVPENLSNPNLR